MENTSQTITLYGIRTCDSCKKAEKSLTAAGHSVSFRDVRAEPLTEAERAAFITEFGDRIINRQSTTWRGLSDWLKASEADAQLAAQPTLMKRPVLQSAGRLILGWDDDIAVSFGA